MTPGRIWEKILQMQSFTYRELESALLKESGNKYLPLLRGKIKYVLKKALREGLIVKQGKRYYLFEVVNEKERIRKLPQEELEVILSQIMEISLHRY